MVFTFVTIFVNNNIFCAEWTLWFFLINDVDFIPRNNAKANSYERCYRQSHISWSTLPLRGKRELCGDTIRRVIVLLRAIPECRTTFLFFCSKCQDKNFARTRKVCTHSSLVSFNNIFLCKTPLHTFRWIYSCGFSACQLFFQRIDNASETGKVIKAISLFTRQ